LQAVMSGDVVETDSKLALLLSIFETYSADDLLESLHKHDGDIADTVAALSQPSLKRRLSPSASTQLKWNDTAEAPAKRRATIVELKTREQIEASPLPCTLILNVLPSQLANALLRRMLKEGETWEKGYFKLFDRTVTSPHVSCFYLPTEKDVSKHAAYAYNGQPLTDIRVFPREMTEAHGIINEVTNTWMHQHDHLQGDDRWQANVAFSNLYDGRHSSVGYHSDQLTYLGPAPCIASLSLGVAREFRLKPTQTLDSTVSLTYIVKLPHNSLFIMGPRCQEDYKHSLTASPSAGLDRHAIAGNSRINITYRQYRPAFTPDKLHTCKCGVQVVLRCAVKASEAKDTLSTAEDGWYRGRRYFWHCDGDKRPDCSGCGYFAWAKLNDHGDPI
ncbi:hypothetical protein BCR37DRAFT_349950, partial [Protomyces lactucae-debilis]